MLIRHHPLRYTPRLRRSYTTPHGGKELLGGPRPPPGILDGQRAIITGASRGIGLAIARTFAGAGATCVLVGRDPAKIGRVTQNLPITYSSKQHMHDFATGDVGDMQFWEDLARAEKVRDKPINILVNAAGVTHYSLLLATNPTTIDGVVRTNLLGSIYGCKVASRLMLRQGTGGCIINISSVMSIKGGKGSAVYAASKAGILGLTRALAGELGPSKIRVNAILPGYIDTAMTDAMTEGAMNQALEGTPLRRLGGVYEIASTALFLATNEFANGSQIVVDGGLSSV